MKLSPLVLQWSYHHNKLSGIIVTEEEAPPTMFAYPTSPSSGQICVRLTDTQPVTWCDQEMECWRQCLRRSPPSDHQGPGTSRGHQGNLLHKTPGASSTFPVSQHLQGSPRENMLCKLCKYMRIFLTLVFVLDQKFRLLNI